MNDHDQYFLLEIHVGDTNGRYVEADDFDASKTSGMMFYGACDKDTDGSLRFYNYQHALMVAKEYMEEHTAIGLPRPDVYITIVQGGDIVDTTELSDDTLDRELVPPQNAS